jgi:hypothetical protein
MTIEQLIEYRSQESNFYHSKLPRGTVCVLRQCQGVWLALAIPQGREKEYVGCFTLIE